MNLSGSPIDYLIAFSGGFLLSFTPCVYPLIPITASLIGLKSAGGKQRAFLLSFTYVTGIAITYSLLGLAASLTGTLFGQISTHPLTYILVGILMAFFGLFLLDLFNLRLPNFIPLPTFKQHNYFSVFILGLSSGLVISPCVTPVLAGILSYLTLKKTVLYGMTLLLSFAYGMGLLLILAGTFGSLLLNLPKSGEWLIYIKRIYAIILMGMGIYFIFKGGLRWRYF